MAAACFLAGPATLAGALVPLVGTAPTNVNFVSGDHDQVTGLVGNGSSKYLNSNRLSNADGQNDFHAAVWVSTVSTGAAKTLIGSGATGTGATHIAIDAGNTRAIFRCRAGNADLVVGQHSTTGLKGMSRSASASFTGRSGGTSGSYTRTSQTPQAVNSFVFARNNSGADQYSEARLAWYSIGSAIDLDLLDSRLTTYMAAIA